MSFRAPVVAAVGAVILAVLVLLGLGVWQVYRYHWKQGVIAERTARTTAPPTDVMALLHDKVSDVNWRHVSATGTWDNAHTMLLANRVRFDILGVEAVTPLLLAPGGPAVLVDRGWMPAQEEGRVLAKLKAQTTGHVVGMATNGSGFKGQQLPSGQWSHLDAAAMGKTLPYAVLPWAVLQGHLVRIYEFDRGVLPLQEYIGYQNLVPHLEYAATWFGLAAVLITIAVIRLWWVPRRDRREGQRSAPAAPPGGGL